MKAGKPPGDTSPVVKRPKSIKDAQFLGSDFDKACHDEAGGRRMTSEAGRTFWRLNHVPSEEDFQQKSRDGVCVESTRIMIDSLCR